jgi:hypothetical protein
MTVICHLPSPDQFMKSLICDETILIITSGGSILELITAQDGESRCQERASVELDDSFAAMCIVAEKDMKMTVLGDRIACGDEEFDGLFVVKCDTGEVVERIPMPYPVTDPIGLMRLAIGRQHLMYSL